MDTLRFSIASTFALVLSAVSLGGCAVDGELPLSESEEVGTSTQALSIKDVDFVMPECRAVLVSVGPAVRNDPNTFACASADPYTGQKRYAGQLETGLTELLDEAQPGTVTCRQSPIVGGGLVCTRSRDRLVEKLCTETRTYECPCGVMNVTVDGDLAAQCRRFPQ
jgi:hypothetical protein